MSLNILGSMMCSLAVLSAAQSDTPPRRELFTLERWYKGVAGNEATFDGVLQRVERKGEVGFGRFNPYRLQLDDGKVREVYVGNQPQLLVPYVGQRLRLTGKAVEMKVEGRQHHEIWPARLERLPAAQKQ